MRRTSMLLAMLALVLSFAACGGDGSSNNANNTNNANARAGANGNSADNGNAQGREGLVDGENNNLRQNANAKTVDSGTAVVTNDNGNKNTSGVSTINDNGKARSDSKKGNDNH